MRFLFEIPAEIWNHAARALWRARAQPGRHCLLAWLEDGTLVSADTAAQWQHPWFTFPSWNAAERRWEVTIRPGFVNGLDPLAQGITSRDDDGMERDDTPLLDRPVIPIPGWRAVGNDEGDTPVPGFFRALGVRANSPSITAHIPLDDPTPPRHLRAVDFVLSVARETLVGRVEVVDASGTSGIVADYAVGLDISRVEQLGRRARLRQERQYEPPRLPTLQERLMGLYSEPNEDTVLVSTLFMLSPAGNYAGRAPDATWQPFVAHNLFWNLAHAPRNPELPSPGIRIRLVTGLAGGIGDAIANQILSQINEYSDRVSNALANASREGRFWTA